MNQDTDRNGVGGTQDVFYNSRSVTPLPLIERAAGIYMWDENGKEYIDGSSGPMVSAIGHGNQAVVDALTRQARQLDYAYSRVARTGPNLEYAARLASLAGPGFERVSLSSGGSEAIETALKFLRTYAVATGAASRRRIISLMPSYHGATVNAAAASGDDSLVPLLDGFATVSDKVPAPVSYRCPGDLSAQAYAERCADALEAKIIDIGPENVLAFLIEPVGGVSTGAVVPPPEYFRSIRRICSQYGVYLVFDEVLCGTGRTGKFVTAHHWPDALPDVIVKAKGLGAGYTPLGATFLPASMVDRLADLGGFESSYSYNANPISCAAGLAVLDEFERLHLVERAAEVGELLKNGLEAIKADSPILGDVRGLGALLAVEMVADKSGKTRLPPAALVTERIRVHALRHGLMLYSRRTSGGRFGDWFMLAPPLTISDAECGELLRRTDAAVADLHAELRVAGVVS